MRLGSAEINGKPRLLCMTRLSDFEETETITVTPMRSFPVIVTLSPTRRRQRSARRRKELPVLRTAAPLRGRQASDGADRRQRGQQFRKRIERLLRQYSPPAQSVRDHEDNKPAFAGPRFFLR